MPPHTAEWFADDLARTDPQVFVEEVEHPVPADSLVGRVVAADFTPVYDGPTERVYMRRAAAAELLEPATDAHDVGAGGRGRTGMGRRRRRGGVDVRHRRPGRCSTARASASTG